MALSKASFGYFCGKPVRISKCNVLIVHNDFVNTADKRPGNEKDVTQIRKVFGNRGCVIQEYANKNATDITNLFSNEQLFTNLFPGDAPNILIVFVLSHGHRGGNIEAENKTFYLTSDVWNGLKGFKHLENALKLLFFAPCRGADTELKLFYTHGAPNPSPPSLNQAQALFPTAEPVLPNDKSFCIVFGNVESKRCVREPDRGTWFVQAICSELEGLRENIDLNTFLVRVTRNVASKFNTVTEEATDEGSTTTISVMVSQGQTPQIVSFYSGDFVIYKNDEFEAKTSKNSDASGNTECINQSAGSLSYSWKNVRRRGRVFIFYDGNHEAESKIFEQIMTDLDFDVPTRARIVGNEFISILNDVASEEHVLTQEGCIAVCILASRSQIRGALEEEDGAEVIDCGQGTVKASDVWRPFVGCCFLLEKPKLFFFLDKRYGYDCIMPQETLNEVQNDHANLDTVKSNENAEIFILFSHGSYDMSQLFQNLNREILRKNGGLLHSAVKSMNSAEDSKTRFSYIESTMTCLVNFKAMTNLPLLSPPPNAANEPINMEVFGSQGRRIIGEYNDEMINIADSLNGDDQSVETVLHTVVPLMTTVTNTLQSLIDLGRQLPADNALSVESPVTHFLGAVLKKTVDKIDAIELD